MEKFNEMINGEQLTLVDFFATWCGPCKMMHPILEQLKEKMGDDIRILKVDVDKNEALSMQYRIQSVPTLMLFKKGEMLWRQSGAMSLNDLMQKNFTATIIALLKTKSIPPHSFYVFLISYGHNCYRRIIFKAVILQPETRNGRLPPGRKH